MKKIIVLLCLAFSVNAVAAPVIMVPARPVIVAPVRVAPMPTPKVTYTAPKAPTVTTVAPKPSITSGKPKAQGDAHTYYYSPTTNAVVPMSVMSMTATHSAGSTSDDECGESIHKKNNKGCKK